MASIPLTVAVSVMCMIAFTSGMTNETKTSICDSSCSGLCDRVDKLEALLTEHFEDYRIAANQGTAPKDCRKAYLNGWTKSGVYTILPDGKTEMDVYCEQELDGGGWTVFQRRVDGSVDFYRNWADYKAGFGNLNREFWLGNDNIHLLTKDHNQKLKIELKSPSGEFAYADYDAFWVEEELHQYKLHVSGISGTGLPGDSLEHHKDQRFSTKDRDYDKDSRDCANAFRGAWWYKTCHTSNLNGLYGNSTFGMGMNWKTWTGYEVSMVGTRMMLKKKTTD